jgi:hypothetical protein
VTENPFRALCVDDKLSTIIRTEPARTPIPIPADFPGYMTNHELVWLYEAAECLRLDGIEGDLLEIGSYKGLSAAALGQSGHVVCIDTFLDSLSGEDTEAEFRKNIAPFVESYEVLRGPSRNRLLDLKGRRFRLILIDGGHDFGSVSTDLRRSWPLLAPGGFMVFDDYLPPDQFPEVKEALDYAKLTNPFPVNPFYSKMVYVQKVRLTTPAPAKAPASNPAPDSSTGEASSA